MADSLSSALLAAFLFLGFAASYVTAADPDPLQDFCVADLTSNITVNGFTCKPAAQVNASDFKSSVLGTPNPINALGYAITQASASNFSALNTQGLSVARIDFAPEGVNPPHEHPRASEVLFLMEGNLEVGFITSTSANTLFMQNLTAGDLFLFPRGSMHFQFNLDTENSAVAISAFNSQNIGRIDATAIFTALGPLPETVLAQGPLPKEVLEKAFGINKKAVASL